MGVGGVGGGGGGVGRRYNEKSRNVYHENHRFLAKVLP